MELRHKGRVIIFHDDIQNLPILKFQKLNKYMMVANEVGNTFEDYDARMAKALSFLQKGMTAEAIQELSNQRQMVFNAFNEYSPIGKAFAVLVHSIDEVVYTGSSSTEIDRVLEHLNEIGLGYLDSLEKLTELKKKIDFQLEAYFPNLFKNKNLNINGLRVSRINAMLDLIIDLKDSKDNQKVYQIEKDILEQDRPNSWNVHENENMERLMEVDFQKFAIEVSKEKNLAIEKITTFTFYASYESIIESNSRHKNSKKNG
jgi:hypothetical protein